MVDAEILTRTYEVAPELLWKAVKEALQTDIGAILKRVEEEQRRAIFTTSVSWTSWGEDMVATVEPGQPTGSLLKVTGQPHTSIMTTKWGEEVHQHQFTRNLVQAVERALSQGTQKPRGTPNELLRPGLLISPRIHPGLSNTDRAQPRRYSVTEDEKFLRDMAHEFEEGFNSGEVDRIMRFYADTYVDVNLRNPVQTRAERREYYAQVMARPGIHLSVQPDDILIRGDLAFVRGTILLTQDAGGGRETTRTELRYLEICERVPDGTWRVMWGMDGPVQEYVAGSQSDGLT